MMEGERHCREDHVCGGLGEEVQRPALPRDFEPGSGVTWEMVHNNLHRLAQKHGEPAHVSTAEA